MRFWYSLSFKTRNRLLWGLMISLLGSLWHFGLPNQIPDSITTRNPRIIDGDSLVMQGERIRLLGIDAPELRQQCQRDNRRQWPCGQAAKKQLARLINRRYVTCKTHGTDYYDRVLAICHTGKATNSLNYILVASGYAIARKAAYRRAEKSARNARLGIWKGAFLDPREWRKLHLSQSTFFRPWQWLQEKLGWRHKSDHLHEQTAPEPDFTE